MFDENMLERNLVEEEEFCWLFASNSNCGSCVSRLIQKWVAKTLTWPILIEQDRLIRGAMFWSVDINLAF